METPETIHNNIGDECGVELFEDIEFLDPEFIDEPMNILPEHVLRQSQQDESLQLADNIEILRHQLNEAKEENVRLQNMISRLNTQIVDLKTKVLRRQRMKSYHKLRKNKRANLKKDLKKSHTTIKSLEKKVVTTNNTLLNDLIKNSAKKKMARRYSDVCKSFALRLYFASPKAFRLVRNELPIASPSLIRNIIRKIKFVEGINTKVLCLLKLKFSMMSDIRDKLVVLVHDEVKLRPRLTYNAQSDEFRGIDYNTGRLIDNGLVLMIKCLNNKSKQVNKIREFLLYMLYYSRTLLQYHITKSILFLIFKK